MQFPCLPVYLHCKSEISNLTLRPTKRRRAVRRAMNRQTEMRSHREFLPKPYSFGLLAKTMHLVMTCDLVQSRRGRSRNIDTRSDYHAYHARLTEAVLRRHDAS